MKLGRWALLRTRSLGTLEVGEATTTVVDEGYWSMPTPAGAGGWPENREERLALEPRPYGFAGCLEADQEHAPETRHIGVALERMPTRNCPERVMLIGPAHGCWLDTPATGQVARARVGPPATLRVRSRIVLARRPTQSAGRRFLGAPRSKPNCARGSPEEEDAMS